MKLKNMLFMAFLLISYFNPVTAETQFDLNKEACGRLKKANDTLNEVYQKIISKYKEDTVFIKQFVMAQRKWIDFRDAYVASKFIPQYQETYGSILPMCQCYLLEEITTERIKQLRTWLDGVSEGDVCTGTIKNQVSAQSSIL